MSVEESTETVTEEQTDNVEAAEAVPAEADAATDGGDVESEPAEPEYTPNFGYKVYDEEKEFPDWAKELVKSKDLEDNFRTYLQKGDAFDPLKEKYEKRGAELTESNAKYDNMIGKLTEYDHYIKKGALGPVFKDWQISDQAVIDYVANLLKAQDDPAAKNAWQAQQDNVVNDWQNNQTQSQLLQQNQELQRQYHEANYAQVLAQPTVAEFDQKLTAALANGETLRSLADREGQAYYQQHGRDTTPAEAVRMVMDRYKNVVHNPPANELSQAQAELADGKPTGTIPRVGKGGGAASPVKKAVKSLDDLRKLVANEYK